MQAKPPKYVAGDRVYSVVAHVDANVIQSHLVGKRHPGYIYEIRTDSGRTLSTPQGLLSVR